MAVIGNQKIEGSEFGSIAANDLLLLFQKLCSIFRLFQVEWKQKSVIDLRDYSTFSTVFFTDYDRSTLALQKCATLQRIAAPRFLFQVDNGLQGKQWKPSNISGTIQPIFFILSPYVWKNNWLLNKNYWDDLDIIDQGHSKCNVWQFCLYLGYPWTNFNQISTTMMASWPSTKYLIIWPLKCRSRSPLKKNHYFSALIRLISTKLSPKWCKWGWQQKHHNSWPWR